MKISVVGPAHPYKGGAAQHTTALAHHLAAAGHDVTIESWIAQYPLVLYPGRPTVDSPELPLFHPTLRQLSWRRPDGWFRHGRRMGHASDLVILMYHTPVQVPSYLTILKALDGTGARSVVIANNVTSHESHRAGRLLTTALLRRVDAVVVHGADQADEARSLTEKPVREAALPPHLPEPALPTDAGAPSAPRLLNSLLFFGLVRPYKGLDVLLRALAIAGAQPTLVVAGEFWESERDTRALIAELGLAPRVTVRPGYVAAAELPRLFSAADALVLPYRAATGSQNTLLAFRYGLPVVATRTGTLPDAVRDGIDGILCAPNDVEDLARAIDRFYQPGEPGRLRAGVRVDDGSDAWAAYLEALTSAVPAERGAAW
jgi:glycosyltransferase involved in cell wall biosynthesis